jgi:hypothetical protein
MTAENNAAEAQQNGNGKVPSKNKKQNKAANGQVPAEEQPIVNGIPVEYVDLSEQESTLPLSKFVSRISAIPILQDAHGYVSQNRIGSLALSTASSTLTTVSKYTQSYQQRFQAHLDKADELGCQSLDFVEQRFPIVKQPTVEIFEAVKKPPMQVYDGVKTTIDSNITTRATSIAVSLNERVTGVVNNVEATVDRWLPDGESAHDDEANQATRVYKLSLTVSSRLMQRMNDQLEKNNIPRSKQDLIKLAETSALLQTTTDKLKTLNETLNEWVLLSTQAAKERIPESVTQRVTDVTITLRTQYEATREGAQKRVADLSAELVTQLNSISSYIKQHSPTLPPFLQERLEPLIRFANTEYTIIRDEAVRSDLSTVQKARNIVSLTQEQVLPILHSSVQEVQDQLKHYTEVASQSKDKVVSEVKTRLHSLGVSVN